MERKMRRAMKRKEIKKDGKDETTKEWRKKKIEKREGKWGVRARE